MHPEVSRVARGVFDVQKCTMVSRGVWVHSEVSRVAKSCLWCSKVCSGV